MFTSVARSLPRFATTTRATFTKTRNFSNTNTIMGVSKHILKEGNGPSPQAGDQVTMEYTGWLKDTSKPDNKGQQFDSSVGRGDFVTAIGKGRVIKGWDEGVVQMKLGEQAILDITYDYAYGDRGFPGAIPPKADLLFQVELKKIN